MQATLVPEKREELTTEGGLDLSTSEQLEIVGDALARLEGSGVRTSLFIDPTPEAIQAARELGADAIELHTGEYANTSGAERVRQLDRLDRAASLASKLELAVHAGHGLTYENVQPVAAIPEIEELNIGHSVIARAVLTGMERAVKDMSRILRRARRHRA
jgi:pyridoxine 5-phosphate synthase